MDPDSIIKRKLTQKPLGRRPFEEVWDNEAEGEVVDVVRTGERVSVTVHRLVTTL